MTLIEARWSRTRPGWAAIGHSGPLTPLHVVPSLLPSGPAKPKNMQLIVLPLLRSLPSRRLTCC
jgi:hypothetical protein